MVVFLAVLLRYGDLNSLALLIMSYTFLLYRSDGTDSAMTREKRSENSSSLRKDRDSQRKMESKDISPPEKALGDRIAGSRGQPDGIESRNKDQERVR